MIAAIRQLVKVEPGGIVRIQSDQLVEGSEAEVLVLARETDGSDAERASWASFIGSGESPGRSVAEIDASIQELRDEWEM